MLHKALMTLTSSSQHLHKSTSSTSVCRTVGGRQQMGSSEILRKPRFFMCRAGKSKLMTNIIKTTICRTSFKTRASTLKMLVLATMITRCCLLVHESGETGKSSVELDECALASRPRLTSLWSQKLIDVARVNLAVAMHVPPQCRRCSGELAIVYRSSDQCRLALEASITPSR